MTNIDQEGGSDITAELPGTPNSEQGGGYRRYFVFTISESLRRT